MRVAHSEEQLEILRGLQVRSAIVVPMRVPSRTIGAMSFFTSESRRRLTGADVELAEQLARRAAVAVENSRLHTQLAEIAETLQISLLPNEIPDVPGWEIAALYRPAETEQRIDVGGDFYEVFEAHGYVAGTDRRCDRARSGSRERDRAHASRRSLRQPPGARSDGDPAASGRGAATRRGHDDVHGAVRRPARDRPDHVLGRSPARADRRSGRDGVGGPGPGSAAGGISRQRLAPGARADLRRASWCSCTPMGSPRPSGTPIALAAAGCGSCSPATPTASPAQLLDALVQALAEFRGGPATDDVAALALRPQSGR